MTNKREIRREVLEILDRELLKLLNEKIRQNDLKNFHFMSANIAKLIPEIDFKNHWDIYRNLQKIKYLESEVSFFNTFDLDVFFENLASEKFCKKSPSIYISYHIGAYRSLMLAFVRFNIDVAIIVDTTIYPLERIEGELLKHFQFAKEIFKDSNSNFKVISANNKNTVIELMQIIKDGYSLLTYIDWNSGYNNDKRGNIDVDFFNSKLSVKQSISYLSYYTKTPIIPCISYYDEEFEPKWNMLKPILPDNHTGVKEYAFIATQLLYSHLEDIIRDNFSQWRGWFHIHKSIVFGESLENKQYDFDINGNYNLAEDVGTFTIIGEHFIFNKTSYKLMKLPDSLFNSISTMKLLNKQVMEASIIKQLYESRMLCKTI